MEKELQSKLDAITSEVKSTWKEEADYRAENKVWLRKSQQIALRILRVLREKEWSQKDLANKLGVKPQVVNKWVKGQENFTLETLSRIEIELGITLIHTENKVNHSEISIYCIYNYKSGINSSDISQYFTSSPVEVFTENQALSHMQELGLNELVLYAGVSE